jgi:histidinol-phosphatase (PHP family)
MAQTCARAVAIGVPAIVFTEHLDFEQNWRSESEDLEPHQRELLDSDGYLRLPPLDVAGYFASIERCRDEFPDLHILTGVEFGQPHLHEASARQHVDLALFDRINGSLHTLADGADRLEPNTLYRRWPADEVMWAYLHEVPRMIAASEVFEVLTHIDYAARAWPTQTQGPFDPRRFEEGFRGAMRALAESGRALEMNTRRLWSWVPQWWSEEGGRAITLGSDAHRPEALAAHFPEAVAMVEYFGFRPGSRPQDFWTR